MNQPIHTLSLLTWAVLAGGIAASSAADPKQGVTVTKQNDRVTVQINGELFTEYWFQGNQHPAITTKKGTDGKITTNSLPTRHVYFWPLMGPGNLPMTRSWPMNPDAQGEEKDHPHHRSLWFSHGAVNGVDFWAEEPKCGKILHDKFLELKSGLDEGVIRSTCKWVAPDGKTVCTDERLFRVFNRPANERLFDFEVTIKAPSDNDVVLGDTKEGSMAIRVAESMRLVRGRNEAGKGTITQNTGIKDKNTWGKKAEWCDYSGPVEGKMVGITIFDNPQNPAHPTWWHVRDYGLFAANPFGVHDFEKKPLNTGDIKVPAGKSVTFKYRLYIHEGDATQAKIAERHKEYLK